MTVPTRMAEFIDASPTPFHCVQTAASWLLHAGYTALDPRDLPERLAPGSKRYIAQEGSLVAFRVGTGAPVETGFRIVAAHTDSPNLRLKPQPVLTGSGYVRLGVEVYGGAILATWTDRDLGIAGKVVVRQGEGIASRLLLLDRPLCRVPNLAIHLNRTVNEQGLLLNQQTHLPAVFALEGDDKDPLRTLLATELDVEPSDVLSFDLMLFDLQRAAISGADGAFVHSARLDNQASCHAALEALLGCPNGTATAVVALFDHEEIGSTTARGADSRLLEGVLERVVGDAELQAPGSTARAIANSFLVSCDMAHAVHPSYADKHDGNHLPKINGGPVIKVNASYRYTTEAETSARFQLWCEAADSPFQWFVVRSDLACGTTVGPVLASRLGIRAIDVGNPMLSMHSAREMCGTQDQARMIGVLGAFFRS